MSDTISSLEKTASKKKLQMAGMVEPKEYYTAQDIMKHRKAGPDIDRNSRYVNFAIKLAGIIYNSTIGLI